MFNKRGVDAVVATVLIIMITVSAVAIIWATVIPMIKNSLTDSTSQKVSLSIETTKGYTVFDPVTNLSLVQIKRGTDDTNLTGLRITFFNGKESKTVLESKVPSVNTMSVYSFNLSGFGTPLKISISPIFQNGNEGETVSEVSNIKTEGVSINLTKALTYGNITNVNSGSVTTNICTSFTYTDWSACVNNQQNRTINTSSPSGCSGGNPDVLVQSCVVTCSSFTYNDWTTCTAGTQTRTVNTSLPSGCTGGTPLVSQSCTLNWYFDKDCDRYGNGTFVSSGSRPTFAGCVNTTAEVSTISITDYDDNNALCYNQTGCLKIGLVGYWPFDETSGTTASDYSGLGNIGTLVNGVLVNQAGKVGNAFYFDGTNDYVTVGSVTSLNYGNNFTISLWFKKSASSTWMWLFTKPGGSWLGLYPSDGRLTWTKSAGVDYIPSISSSLSSNVWYLGTMTFSNGNLTLYINGTNIGQWTGITLTTTSGADFIGQRSDNYQYFNGSIDEVSVWNRTLSATEVAQLYNSGSGLSLK